MICMQIWIRLQIKPGGLTTFTLIDKQNEYKTNQPCVLKIVNDKLKRVMIIKTVILQKKRPV